MPRSPVSAARLALVLVLFVAACDDGSGVLLEIHKADGVSSEVYELEVFVGVGHHEELHDPAWWASAPVSMDDARVTFDGELGAHTYRLLLEPDDGLSDGADVVFVVAGYKTGQTKPVVFGRTERPVQFADGEVRVIDLPLLTFSDARHGVTASGCAWWNDTGDRSKQHAIVPRADGDCDSFTEGHDETTACRLDCDDRNPAIHPGATETCANGVDENCCDDGDGQLDLDQDGYVTCGLGLRDCVDGQRGGVGAEDAFGTNLPPEQIHPAAPELCDGVDNDCNSLCDDGDGFDGDGDGYLNCTRQGPNGPERAGVHRLGLTGATCAPSGLDCADAGLVGGVEAKQIHPEAADIQCDGVDQDCDGSCDQVLVGFDGDGDGFNACTTEPDYLMASTPQCALGTGADCGGDDWRFEYPGGAERCDGVDFDCDLRLFPIVSPCFLFDADAGTRCVIGRRGCNDTPGTVTPGFSACTHDASAPSTTLPSEFCQVTCTPGVDPIQCLTSGRVDCAVRFVGTTIPCQSPPTEVTLRDDGSGCAYALVGGESQGDWEVTLVNPQGSTGATATGCGSKLRVVHAPPDAEERVVLVVTAQSPQLYRLRRVEGCSTTSNMDCGGP